MGLKDIFNKDVLLFDCVSFLLLKLIYNGKIIIIKYFTFLYTINYFKHYN